MFLTRCFDNLFTFKVKFKLLNIKKMEGKRGRGKPRISMLDDIKADESYEKIKRLPMDREYWGNLMPRTLF